MKKIGKGAYGTVYLGIDKADSSPVAIKQLDQVMLLKMRKQESVMREKAILKQMLGLPFVIQLKCTCMDSESLYFVFEHCRNGSLSQLVKEKGNF